MTTHSAAELYKIALTVEPDTRVERSKRRPAAALPEAYAKYLAENGAGQIADRRFMLFAQDPEKAIHPAETLQAANSGRAANFPLLLFGRDAMDDFGFRKEDLRKKNPPVWVYDHEEEKPLYMADSWQHLLEQLQKGPVMPPKPTTPPTPRRVAIQRPAKT